MKERLYNNLLLNHLLPGIKEEQLPLELISYNSKGIAWERTYKAISPIIYGDAFLKSIGVRAAAPSGPIPPYLLEKRRLPTHSVEVPANSPLGLTIEGNLTNGPQDPEYAGDLGHYAPQGHRHYRDRPAADVEGVRTLQFPNTQYNRDFLAADPFLRVAPYPMQSPLEQGSPLIAFQTNLEIDVPEGSPLRVTPQGVLTEKPGPNEPAVNGIRTIRFLNTPHNWLTLAAPVLTAPSRRAGPDNPYFAKYLNENAKPVGRGYWDPIEAIWDTPAPSEWKAPITKLVALGDSYPSAEVEALAIEQLPMTFEQDSIHRILVQIRGNPDPYLNLWSRTATDVTETDVIESLGHTYKAATYVVPAAVAPVAPARVVFYFNNGIRDIGLAAAWGPAGGP